VDHFSARPHNPYEHAETLEDLRDGLHVVRTLIQMGRFEDAFGVFNSDLVDALIFNLEAGAETVALLRPFFPRGWGALPSDVSVEAATSLATTAGNALGKLGQASEALAAHGSALRSNLERRSLRNVWVNLENLSTAWRRNNHLANEDICLRYARAIAELLDDSEALFVSRLFCFEQQVHLGRWSEAELLWQELDPMGRDWARASYRPGEAEYQRALARFYQDVLRDEDLRQAERLARQGRNREVIRNLHKLRGEWLLERSEWRAAVDHFNEAVAMAQAVNMNDSDAQTQLAYAKLRSGELVDPRAAAELLAKGREPDNLALAVLWLAIGDSDRALKHARAAYEWAWANGDPFVHRHQLKRVRALLKQLKAEVPDLSPYDRSKADKLPWQDAVQAAIETLAAAKKSRSHAAARRAPK